MNETDDLQPGLAEADVRGGTTNVDTQGQPGADSSLPTDLFLSKRPRDARLIHMILAHYGVSSYQERAPLQLMDFAYRYTSSILQDALHFTSEGHGVGYSTANRNAGEAQTVNTSALRLAINSRTHYQFNSALSKELYLNLAQEKNRVALPPLSKEWGLKLPPEQYVLIGRNWETASDSKIGPVRNPYGGNLGLQQSDDMDIEDDNVEGGTIEDVFGPSRGLEATAES